MVIRRRRIWLIVIISIIAILLALPMIFRGDLAIAAKAEINRRIEAKVEFDYLDLSFVKSFPNLQVELIDLSVVSPDSSRVDTMLSVAYAELDIDLKRLLFDDELIINKLALDEPTVNIVYLEGGLSNLDYLQVDTTSTDETEAIRALYVETFSPEQLVEFRALRASVMNGEVEREVLLSRLDSALSNQLSAERYEEYLVLVESYNMFSELTVRIEDLTISDGDIRVIDRENGVNAIFLDVDCDIESSLNDTILDMDINFSSGDVGFFADNVWYVEKGMISFDVSGEANISQEIFKIDNSLFKYNDLPIQIGGELKSLGGGNFYNTLSISSGKDIDLNQFLRFVNLTLDKESQLIGEGDLSIDGTVTGPFSLRADFVPDINLNVGVVNGSIYPKTDPMLKLDNIDISTNIVTSGGDYGNLSLEIERLNFNLLGQEVDARLNADIGDDNTLISGLVKADVDIQNLTRSLSLDKEFEGSAVVDFIFSFDTDNIITKSYDDMFISGFIDLSDIALVSNTILAPDTTLVADTTLIANASLELDTLSASESPLEAKLYGDLDLVLERLKVSFTASEANIDTCQIVGGDSDVSLFGSIDNYLNYVMVSDMMDITLNMRSENLDIDKILPIIDNLKYTFAVTDSVATIDSTAVASEFGISILDSLSVIFRSEVDHIRGNNLDFNNFSGDIIVSDHTMKLQDISANIMGGDLLADGSYTIQSSDRLVADFNLNLLSIENSELFEYVDVLIPELSFDSISSTGNISGYFHLDLQTDNSYNLIPESVKFDGELSNDHSEINSYGRVYLVDQLKTHVQYSDDILAIERVGADIFDGTLFMKGSINFADTTDIIANISIDAKDWNSDKAYSALHRTSVYIPEGLAVEGEVSATFDMSSRVDSELTIIDSTIVAKGEIVSDQFKMNRSEALTLILDSLDVPIYDQFDFRDVKLVFDMENSIFSVQPSAFRMDRYLGYLKGDFHTNGDLFMGVVIDRNKSDENVGIDLLEEKDDGESKKGKLTVKGGSVIYGNIDDPKYHIKLKLNRSSGLDILKEQLEKYKEHSIK